MEQHILANDDIETWKNTKAHKYIQSVLDMLDNSIKSKTKDNTYMIRPIVHRIVSVITNLKQILQDTPPQEGIKICNPAFISFHKKIKEHSASLLHGITDNSDSHEYFYNSFGNSQRIDFGTGHEFNFLAFISSLFYLGVLEAGDAESIVFEIFWNYWDFIQMLHATYHLAPAGTHGSWGLDDFVMLPFLFGSSQLINHPELKPDSIINLEIAEAYQNSNAFCKRVFYLYKVKTGSFEEHSRLLYSLRNLSDFVDIHRGVYNMYIGEVMNKFVVVQSFLFGSVFQWEEMNT